nr:PCTP protein [Hymenolepis microstoma]
MNHSVFHAAAPPKKEYVRAISYLSGYIVRNTGPNSCFFGFVTQSDPRGKFPAWAVNKIAQIIAPSTVSKLVKAARAYPEWKAKNSPSIKPWIYPEQNKLAPLNVQDILSSPDFELSAKEAEVSEDAPSTITELLEDLADDEKTDVNNKSEVSDKKMVKVVEEDIVPQSAPFPTQRSIPIG